MTLSGQAILSNRGEIKCIFHKGKNGTCPLILTHASKFLWWSLILLRVTWKSWCVLWNILRGVQLLAVFWLTFLIFYQIMLFPERFYQSCCYLWSLWTIAGISIMTIQVNLDMTQWDHENWSVICKIRRIHMTNIWYASDWDQAYCPSYAKIRRTVIRHIQVHLYLHVLEYCNTAGTIRLDH